MIAISSQDSEYVLKHYLDRLEKQPTKKEYSNAMEKGARGDLSFDCVIML